ncbi:MAG: prepilin-type N-terminal cleavage/methylation domain-containing protein [Verrucomicrobia bacterium]|nr:prepilin-type N-terminal cleavage/methylation domain-containing protein [Verrucomicrobiota bacterium]
MISQPFQSRSRRGGFTLVELLLAVTLLAGLMGAAVFGFSSLQRSAQLNEGVERLETAMRFARAHAANTGRKVQVVVTTAEASSSSSSSTDPSASVGSGNGDEPFNSLSILWEADPARAPGVFESIPSLSGDVADVSELVEIRPVGRESKNPEANEGSATQDSPDGGYSRATASASPDSLEMANRSMNNGSSLAADTAPDSDLGSEALSGASSRSSAGGTATIVLASRDSDDSREVAVHLESVTGTTRRRWKESSVSGSSQTSVSQDDTASSNLSSGSGRSTQQASSRMATSPSMAKSRR